MSCSALLPELETPATSWSIWITPRTTSSIGCAPTGMSLLPSCAPAPAICRLGSVSVPRPSIRLWLARSPDSWPTSTARTAPAPTGVISADWLDSPTRNLHAASPAVSLPGSGSCLLNPSWLPMPPLCLTARSIASCQLIGRSIRLRSPSLCLLRQPLQFTAPSRPPPLWASIPAGCTGCGFGSVSLHPIGVSPICGSPNGCCAAASRPTKSELCCGSEAPAFLVVTPIPKITCAAHSHERRAKPCLSPRAVPLLAFADRPAARPVFTTLQLTTVNVLTRVPILLPMARHRRALPPLLTRGRRADENRSSIQHSHPCGACSPHSGSPPTRLSQPSGAPIHTL